MDTTTLGYFHDRAAADAAYNDLVQPGYSRDSISVLRRGTDEDGEPGRDTGATGASGAGLGGVEGLLLGAAAMLIPGIGPIVAVGPLAAALAGAITGGVTGAVVGGVVGALEDAGVDRDAARYYDERLRHGGVLLAVRTDPSEIEPVQTTLRAHGADLRNVSAAQGTPDWPGGEDVPLSRNERREYLSAPEDVARTTAAHDPNDLDVVDNGVGRPTPRERASGSPRDV